jgi:hypothetical protein
MQSADSLLERRSPGEVVGAIFPNPWPAKDGVGDSEKRGPNQQIKLHLLPCAEV